MGHLIKKRFAPIWSKFLLFRVDLILGRLRPPGNTYLWHNLNEILMLIPGIQPQSILEAEASQAAPGR